MKRGFRSVDWDSVAPLNPHDRIAAQVTAKGAHYEVKREDSHRHSDVPLPHRRPTRQERINPSWRDLTGAKLGRLTVIGIATDAGASPSGQAWVCRCVCGNYEHRRTKAIKKILRVGAENMDVRATCCQWCNATDGLRTGKRGRDVSKPLLTRERAGGRDQS